ncbi:MAG: recombinase family protein [Candidatus Omnitrophica bacterium]|nr:recombinase family protein [Candidatus Omnitrophota bacterium]
MKVAIYTRYSSENQSEKSTDDQIRVCKTYIANHEMTVEDRHIYVDEAISGSIVNRPGLQALQIAAENKEFEALVVDDLSRLSRSNHQMLTLVLKFNYLQVKIISVSDGIITDDENSKLGIHLRGLMNELYLDDLKKKTMRGLEGQKLRGFSAGENVYGYSTKPVGELKLNKKGQAKYEGKVHQINPEEADIVKRVYQEFINGKSLNKIVRDLNQDKIPTKKGFSGGWSLSSISKILRNARYIGKWTWKRCKGIRDPITGRRKRILRPEKEWMTDFRKDLIIIDQQLWEKAEKRWQEIDHSWPLKKNLKANIGLKQHSYIHSTPTHLLSGLMKCHSCGGNIILISGKASGYYGCFNARRKTCSNTLIVSRKRIESIIISELKEQILTIKNLDYVYKKVETITASGMNEVPEQIKKKKVQYDKTMQEVQNYLNYIKMGNFSKVVSDALQQAETNSENLKQEMQGLEYQQKNTFQAPPTEWIKHRLERLNETLNKDTVSAALTLKKILGPVELEPISHTNEDFYNIVNGEKKFKPYYMAHTKIQTLALLDDKDKGSNWYSWWRWRESNPRP